MMILPRMKTKIINNDHSLMDITTDDDEDKEQHITPSKTDLIGIEILDKNHPHLRDSYN